MSTLKNLLKCFNQLSEEVKNCFLLDVNTCDWYYNKESNSYVWIENDELYSGEGVGGYEELEGRRIANIDYGCGETVTVVFSLEEQFSEEEFNKDY